MDETGETEAPPPRRSRMGEAVREWMPRAVFEALLITFGLIAALALNGWNEDRQRAERIAEARHFFVEELQANRAMLASDRVYPHHVRLRRALDGYLQAENPTEQDRARAFAAFKGGVHPALFRDAVWRSISMGDLLPHMKPREVFMLADIYRLQEELAIINRAVYAGLIEVDPGTRDPAEARKLAVRLSFYLGDVVAIEHELIAMYDEAIQRLSPGVEPNAAAPRR